MMSASNVRPPDDASRHVTGPLEGMRVLVVEDDPDTCELLGLVLEAYGAETAQAGSVAAALKHLERWKADVLLSDLKIAGEDGFSLIRRIRSMSAAEGGEIPAAALTGYVGEDQRDRALRAGFQLVITKPVEAEELVKALVGLKGRQARGQV